MPPDPVAQVLTAYPQIYHACHLEHPRARTNAGRISTRESWILGHLDSERPASPAELARHLSLRGSTVSEALKRLERLGYITRRKAVGDRRRIEVFLAPSGVTAMKNASVLDARRVNRLLAQLSSAERAAALEGLALLARAARALNVKEPKRWNRGDA
jgi:DNA-binding MarR family transcriptional regulator